MNHKVFQSGIRYGKSFTADVIGDFAAKERERLAKKLAEIAMREREKMIAKIFAMESNMAEDRRETAPTVMTSLSTYQPITSSRSLPVGVVRNVVGNIAEVQLNSVVDMDAGVVDVEEHYEEPAGDQHDRPRPKRSIDT